MAYSNPFEILADSDNDFPSLVAANRLNQARKSPMKSSRRWSEKRAVNAKSKLPSNSNPRFEPEEETNADSSCVVESGSRRMFGVSEEGELEKLLDEGEGGGRCYGGGGPRKCYRSTRRTCCRPGRTYADQEIENYMVSMSSKYRLFDRHNLFGRGKAVKREGFGRGNWGKIDDEGLEERPVGITNCSGTYAMIEEHADKNFNDDANVDQSEDDEAEDKEMTLDEYEKILEEKKKALQSLLLELSAKDNNDGSFIKLDLEYESANEEDLTDNEFSEESEKEELVDGFVIVDAAEEWNIVFGCGAPSIENPGHFADHDVI